MLFRPSALRGPSLVLGVFSLFLFLACSKVSQEKEILRVGTSGDYEPFSGLEEGRYSGFDVELARRFADAHDLELQFIPFKWGELLSDLEMDKFDVAMSGVTIRKDRSLVGQFSVPTATSGAVIILPADSKMESLQDLDDQAVRLGVNLGGHLERVTRKHFLRTTIVTSPNNQALPNMLEEGVIDALVTDTMEAPYWLSRLKGAKALAPFTQDLKAVWIQADRMDLAQQLNAWLVEQEANGSLSALRESKLPHGNDVKTADPFSALLAAMVERLSLMSDVAESKRTTGKAIEDLEQEKRVLRAAIEGVSNEAVRMGIQAPDAKVVAPFFRAQIEAAKAIQWHTLTQSPSSDEPPDLVDDLRPALVRISARINQLICLLPGKGAVERQNVLEQINQALAPFELPATEKQQLTDSFLALAGFSRAE